MPNKEELDLAKTRAEAYMASNLQFNASENPALMAEFKRINDRLDRLDRKLSQLLGGGD